MQGGLASDPGKHVVEAKAGFWDFLVGASKVTEVPHAGAAPLEPLNPIPETLNPKP